MYDNSNGKKKLLFNQPNVKTENNNYGQEDSFMLAADASPNNKLTTSIAEDGSIYLNNLPATYFDGGNSSCFTIQ